MSSIGSHPRGPLSPDGRRRWPALFAGLVVAGGYLAGAMVTGRLDPLARRPILDGFAPPPPYQWVSPPPSRAKDNQPPASGSFRVKFGADGVSRADVLSTDDLQVTLILSKGTFPTATGQSAALVTIKPLAPNGLGAPPSGLRILGNVYRLQATNQPGGQAIQTLAQRAQLTLVYPPSPDGLIHAHTVIQSKDGKSWTTLSTNDAGLQAGVEVTALGYFAVSENVVGGKHPFPLGKIIQYAIVGLLVLVIAVPIVLHEVRERRARKRRAARRSRRR
jgi:hypothetical protein